MRGVAFSIQPDSPGDGQAPSQPKLELVRSHLDCLFRPRSVALVGASSRVDAVGRQLLDNLLDFGYTGRLSPRQSQGRGDSRPALLPLGERD